MPTLATLAVFVLAGLTLLAIPGPNHLYIATRSAAQGRSAGFASAFGVELGTLVHVCAAAVGLSALVASSAVALAFASDLLYAAAAAGVAQRVRATGRGGDGARLRAVTGGVSIGLGALAALAGGRR